MPEQNLQPQVPCLPESAPFSPEQRAYLNGFLAGLFSRAPAPASPPASSPSVETLTPLSILFGSQTGNAENLAKRIAREAGKRGFAPTVQDLAKFPVAQLASEKRLLIITSTYGDGDPPDNAKPFWDFVSGATAPKLGEMRFSICALGDSNYPKFCAFGKDLDSRLESLSAQRAHPRADCDVEFEEPFAKWLNAALSALAAASSTSPSDSTVLQFNSSIVQQFNSSTVPRFNDSTVQCSDAPTLPRSNAPSPAFTRTNPFLASPFTSRNLNCAGSQKETMHFEITLDDPDLSYEAGDTLGVIPSNCPQLVEDILAALKFSGDEAVLGANGTEVALREALLRQYEITKIPQPFLQAMAERSGDQLLKALTAPGVNGELTKFLWGREIIDLLLAHPAAKFAPKEFVGLLKKLQPRLYSISSSPKAHPGEAHLTVSIVRYESLARKRKGVCSTFLADRRGLPVPVFVHRNKNFRPPLLGDAPMIMVGPGTGIAPFRAFLEERRACGAKGRNWLFFGDQRAATDFLYRDEVETMLREGTLHRLDVAFSRDQTEKVYVQHRMREHAKEMFAWLEAGAHFYVCGDATRMAKDVDAALREIVQANRQCTPEEAAEYVNRLKSEGRYQRDVY
jgi:sulfite reductase (NADPH) flavoprotein alpha-component